ncbi:hypothetical protein TrCOL_g3383 [Triparma columacea]|uniref:Uncharacterized protein n=1 Tax=Triparma columacea TaxID=722753 RepID=A0A9W7L1N0_9STRA|nr:hypothetical protein TrCOL_g3383 [Triparma columacea]
MVFMDDSKDMKELIPVIWIALLVASVGLVGMQVMSRVKYYTGKTFGFFLGLVACSLELLAVGLITANGWRKEVKREGGGTRFEVLLLILYSALFVSLLSFSLYIFRYRNSQPSSSRRKSPRLNKHGVPRGVSPESVQNANERWNKSLMEDKSTYRTSPYNQSTRYLKPKIEISLSLNRIKLLK